MDLNYICHTTRIEPPSRDTCGPSCTAGNENNSPDQLALSRGTPHPDPDIQLRSASRKPKNRRRRRAASSSTQASARECHNLIEKQYRTRLKRQFERLLAVLPAAQARDFADRDTAGNPSPFLSRGQVLDAARERILKLEMEVEMLTMRRNRIQDDVARMNRNLLEGKNTAALPL